MVGLLIAFMIGSFVQYYFIGGDEQPSMSGYFTRMGHWLKAKALQLHAIFRSGD